MDTPSIVAQIRTAKFFPGKSRPWLLFDASAIAGLRQRVAGNPGLAQRLGAKRDRLIKTPAEEANALQAYVSADEAVQMANAYVLLGDVAAARWAQRRIEAVMKLETWCAPVHGKMRYDHCMGNISAHVAVVHDYLGDLYSPAQTKALIDGLRRQTFEKFLAVTTKDDPEWWFRDATESNWKVMTCGESGLGFLSFVDVWPEVPEAVARAAQGVLQTLDKVPAEGDWPEGINYWFCTLMMGLRFARALRRATNGAVNLFEHPALRVTGDFATMLTTPAGRIYNFNDNTPALDERSSEAVAMLAVERKRGDWMGITRAAPADTALWLACDDPAIASAPPTRRQARFPRSGAAVMRSDGKPDATFVGLKAGDPTAGHSHLDANSFVIEARGQPLVIDHPYWPQAHFLGFFDTGKFRWNFDGPGTVGHSTLMVDGRGQSHAKQYAASLGPIHDGGSWQRVVGDASKCYPGLLRKFIRTIVLVGRDHVVIRDVVECEGERHTEWLLHHVGEASDRGVVTLLQAPSVKASVTPFLPDRAMGWRTSDVTRTSVYVNSDTLVEQTLKVKYRSFAPFRQAERFEFLFGIKIDGAGDPGEWTFDPGTEGKWSLKAAGAAGTLVPEGDGVTWRA
ncbi:MAG: heparinase II/III family protein [Planctomycetota bacterium]|nr:heparinase II/III family protein [Planctomycetota bacterium]